MLVNTICILLFLLPVAMPIKIPFIDNAIFIALSNLNDTIIINQTCHQCLCTFNSSYLALNCFPNNTCQFFHTFPRSYIIQSSLQARLYFLQRIFPNTSQCGMYDTTDLMNKLDTANKTSANITGPRCLVVDNHGYLVTVSSSPYTIVRFYPTNLTVINEPVPPIFASSPQSITYYNETYYVGFVSLVLIMNSNDFTILQNITAPLLSVVRDMILLHNGQILVVASTDTATLLFFNASDDYNLFYEQTVNYTDPHGLLYVNDSYFYATSWSDNTIYSYSAINNSIVWMEKLFLDARPVAAGSDGYHLKIDNCDRYWFILGGDGIKVFDNQGLFLENVTELTPFNFDAVITDDYVIYITDMISNEIVRIDPNTEC